MRIIRKLLLCGAGAALLTAQQFQFNLDHLAPKANQTVDISLSSSMLQFAAKFMDGHDPEEAQVKKLLNGISGIYVKSYEFKSDGVWALADLERIRNQLRPPQWVRIVGVTSKEDGENAEIYVRSESQKTTGVAILVAEAKQLTVVNIVGSIDLNSLAELGGHFGIPKVEPPKK